MVFHYYTAICCFHTSKKNYFEVQQKKLPDFSGSLLLFLAFETASFNTYILEKTRLIIGEKGKL